MTALVDWMPTIAALVTIGLLLGAVLAPVFLLFSNRVMGQLAPGWRFGVALGLCGLPLGIAGGLLVVAFVPSSLDAVGIVADHCYAHLGHAFHLCFEHGRPPVVGWPLAIAALPLIAVLRGAAVEASRWRQTRRWTRGLRALARRDSALDAWIVPTSGVAFTVGLFRPEVFVSERHNVPLTAEQYDAVIAHERAHARRHHALTKSVARLMTSLHFPATRARLLATLDLAAEQVCDEVAARVVGDRTPVAEAIVQMARVVPTSRPLVFAEGFATHVVEARVRGLLEPSWLTPSPAVCALVAAAVVGAVGMHYESLHHTVESLLAHLF